MLLHYNSWDIWDAVVAKDKAFVDKAIRRDKDDEISKVDNEARDKVDSEANYFANDKWIKERIKIEDRLMQHSCLALQAGLNEAASVIDNIKTS